MAQRQRNADSAAVAQGQDKLQKRQDLKAGSSTDPRVTRKSLRDFLRVRPRRKRAYLSL